MDKLGVVEEKVLFALMDIAKSDNVAFANQTEIAKNIGYKKSGGAITFALKTLELSKKIKRISKNTYRVLI